MGKITFGPAQMLPLDKLVASAASVRRVNAGVSLAELAGDIGRRGLLQSLSVRPVLDEAGAESGRYTVVAGGRRLAALQILVRAKRLNKTAPLPCTVGRAELAAEEDSLAENTMREALHPLDQFRAFRALREERAPLLRHPGRGAPAPEARDCVAEAARPLCRRRVDDGAADGLRGDVRPRPPGGSLGRPVPQPHAGTLGHFLAEGAVRASDKRVLFVGLAAYETVGGLVERDLFDEDGGGYLRDPGLLGRLAGEKLDTEAERVRGEG